MDLLGEVGNCCIDENMQGCCGMIPGGITIGYTIHAIAAVSPHGSSFTAGFLIPCSGAFASILAGILACGTTMSIMNECGNEIQNHNANRHQQMDVPTQSNMIR
jgi:hypothetical protein